MKKLLLFFVFCYATTMISQVTNEGEPASWGFAEKSSLEAISLPQIDIKKIKTEDDINDKLQAKPYRVGMLQKVNYGLENSGTWTQLDNGDRIWRILFSSKDAIHLSVNFDQFYLPKGANIYLYNDDRTDLLGAYTETSNNEEQMQGTWFVNGNSLWIEYYEPKKVKGKGLLNVSSVIHGYRMGHSYQKGYLSDELQKALNDSGDCNHDVDCPIGPDFEAQKDLLKKSVALLYMGNGYICSGALVNNTSEDKTPYFLSANHCFTDPDGVDSNPTQYSMRFNWISPNPVCAISTNSANSVYNITSGGSILRARNAGSDVLLVELNNNISPAWDVTYAGWDRTDTKPTFEVGIHHPAGDIMKICRDDTGATKGVYNGAQSWVISGLGAGTALDGGWELGVTEGGSSGSPLFDQNGRIIGQLFGGAAACGGINDNNAFDAYGRFATSWDTGSTPDTRLQHWLAPSSVGTNPNTLESLPLVENFAIDGSVKSSMPVVACGSTEIIPTIIVRNAGNTSLTSLTINWDIDGGTSTAINWTGSLAKNETDNIVLAPLSVSPGDHVFNVSSSNPNGVIDENTANDFYSPAFSIESPTKIITTQVHLTLTTDDYPEETTWKFKDGSGNVISEGGPYSNPADINTIFQESFNVSLDECYTFEINDTAGDGICCGFGNGSYSLKTDDDTSIIEGGNYGSSESVQMSSVNTLAVNDEFLEQNISIFPNPSSGFVQIKIREWTSDLDYEVYNILGQTL
ncbi:MAG: secretion system protein Por, partial [Aureibaculum sp.]|nr:secretion system protein Por [Aureibaculum sp.]